jgi:diaminohydroxyphosphoribosylaminopyrimidine deaminase/5-amino-6-(5-phosphoribosylamino)uracil reductase
VGSGFHQRAGGPHAEVLALAKAGPRARGSTLYVTLEPCAHFGRTPPCVEAVVKAGVRRVVAAMTDPNPRNRGRGLKKLKAHGLLTRVGILEKEARRLNEPFVTWATLGRPWVTVKAGQSLDGKIATRTGASRWITSPAARRWSQALRSQADAILVGSRTVLLDDPELTVRGAGPGRQPIKVILDSRLSTPVTAKIFRSKTPVILAALRSAPQRRQAALERAGAQILRLPGRGGRPDLKALLRELAKREVTHLLVEGGGEVIASVLKAGAADRMIFVIAPTVIGGREAVTSVEGQGVERPGQALRFREIVVGRFGPDLVVTGYVQRHR